MCRDPEAIHLSATGAKVADDVLVQRGAHLAEQGELFAPGEWSEVTSA
jgi:hypothetical protein